MNEIIRQQSAELSRRLARPQRVALLIGVAGLAAMVAGYVSDPLQFFRSYLLAFIFWIGLPLGSLVILMIHHVAGGAWGYAIRRLLEAGTRTLPLMFVAVLPLLFAGVHHLYEWSHPAAVAADPLLQHKASYLNEPMFIGRSLLYFAIWMGLIFLLNKWSTNQDRAAKTHWTRRLQRLSGPGIPLYALTVTFASMDWIMSLEPHWYSTIYGVIYMVGQALLTWAFITVVAVWLGGHKPLDAVLTNSRLRDLGTFTLATVMLWAYVSFSQFLIIWAGNLPEEITWYMRRLEGRWLLVGILLIAFHFALPFVLLVSSRLKAQAPVLIGVAVGLMVTRLVDLFWITAPAFHADGAFRTTGFHLAWMDVVAPLGLGGLMVSYFFWQLRRQPLLALNDPRFADLLEAPGDGHG